MIADWPVVVATWLDASTEYNSVNATEYVRTYKPFIRRATGFLIGEDDLFVHIAMDDDRTASSSDSNCQTITTIPKVLLRRPLERYQPPPPRKRKK